jgi:Phytoene dehydrogenase and related proteins
VPARIVVVVAHHAIVVGSGPNGLAGAVTLARAGLNVTVLEASDHIGGGTSTLELTEPGAWHDVCSAVHPMAVTSDFFRRFELASRVDLLTPEISYAQAITPQRAAIAYRDLSRTAGGLGVDARAWARLFRPYVGDPTRLADFVGNAMLPLPTRPMTAAVYGPRVLQHGSRAWNRAFRGVDAPALLAGVFAHTIQRMPSLGSAAAGLALAALAHGPGWPIPRGGSATIARAMADDLVRHGGRIETGVRVRRLSDLPPATITLLDVTPRALVAMDDGMLPALFRRRMRRFRYGNAAAKADFLLSEPVPWHEERLRQAVTVHLGGTRDDIAQGEAAVAAGRHPDDPYVLTCQPTVLDPGRAPVGKHILWAYTHVPAGSGADPLEPIVSRIENFAPGFRDTILASSSSTAQRVAELELNDIGGDIAAGDVSAWQLIARPRLSAHPWDTPRRGTYLCSASTVPGPGVHGQCGWLAARRALSRELGMTEPPDLSPQPD